MPIEITKLSGETMGTADRDYFLDENRELTTDEEKAAFVLIRKGQDIPKETADKYGIGKTPQTKTAPAKTSVKKAAPVSNKSAEPTENKGEDE
jgi:hypothetical protein